MLTWFMGLEVWVQALIGTTFTWGMTALGAALVFLFKNIQRNMFNLMLGFASGVMIAASFGVCYHRLSKWLMNKVSSVGSWLLLVLR